MLDSMAAKQAAENSALLAIRPSATKVAGRSAPLTVQLKLRPFKDRCNCDFFSSVCSPLRARTMPTIFRVGGYRFFFFSNEAAEPPHIHIEQAERYAKFWLEPVSLARSRGFRSDEVSELHQIVVSNRKVFLKAWHDYFA